MAQTNTVYIVLMNFTDDNDYITYRIVGAYTSLEKAKEAEQGYAWGYESLHEETVEVLGMRMIDPETEATPRRFTSIIKERLQ